MVLTLCITVGGIMWSSIQRDVQLFEPWRHLGRGWSKSLYASLVRVDAPGLGLLGGAVMSVARGSLIMLWASLSVIMIQFATVFSPPLLELLYASSARASVSGPRKDIGVLEGNKGLILGALGVAIHVVIFINLLFLILSGRTRPFLPRAPTTIASQVLYLCRSDRLLEEFANTSMVSKKGLATKLQYVDRKCLFGWFWWPRGQAWHVGVEQFFDGDHWWPFSFVNGTSAFSPCT